MIFNLLYFLGSTVEFSAFFTLVLALFRFRFRKHIKEIFIASIVMAIISFSLEFGGYRDISLLAQIPAVFLLFAIIFKQRLLYSAWITAVGYASYTIIQLIFLFILVSGRLFTVSDLQDQLSYRMRLIQLFTIAIIYLVSIIIKNNNEGFAFSFQRKGFKSSKITFSLIAVVSIFAISIAFYVLYSKPVIAYLVGFSAIALFITLTLVIMSIIQNRKQMLKGGY